MRSATFPESVAVVPGERGFISVSITNTSSVIDAYEVQVFGLDPSWIAVEPDRLSLFPGQTENVGISVQLPDDYPASNRTLAVNVSSADDPEAFSLNQVELAVQPRTETTVRVDPVMVTGGRSARFGLVVSNQGNAAVSATPYAIDPEDLADFTYQPTTVIVPPGRDQVVEVTATGGRAWFGQPRARTFTFGVEAEKPVETIGTFIQKPRISRWLISLLGLLTAAAVFAAVLSRTFDRVVDEASVSNEVLDAALSSGEAGGAGFPTNPGGLSGQLISSTTGQGLSGVTAELFVVEDDATVVATAATDDQGTFVFGNLGPGSYLLRLSGSGVDQELWYPNARTSADAEPIAVELGEVRPLDRIVIAGIPVDVTGKIAVDDPTGVTVSIVVPGASGEAAIVATTELLPDGSFVLPGIPSPGTYQMIVQKPGSPPEVRDLVLQPGQPVDDIEVTVRPGNGLISGNVSGPSGPLGGATVTATAGTTQIQTVSLTESPVGTYSLRNLATPGQYTVTITAEGYAPESRTVVLTNDLPSGSFDARLTPARGSIQGRALVDGSPARGITVTVTGGATTRTAGVVSQGGAAGTYTFTGLEAPGTYTLTFSGQGLVSQVRVVDLDPNSGTENVTGVDVSLVRQRSLVSGIIRDPDSSPAAQATVTLSDGTNTRTVLSADEPAGRFEFDNVAPGSYTLTASRTGTEPVTVLVTVTTTSAAPPLDLQLGPQASIVGQVNGFDPTQRSVVLRLFEPALFPNGTPIATVSTNSSGGYTFSSLDAPVHYVVAVYAGETAADPLDSAVVRTVPGQPVTAPTFTVTLP